MAASSSKTDQSGKVITLICPNLRCRSLLQVPERTRGNKVRCGRCGHNFIVPDASTAKKDTTSSAMPSSDKAEKK